MSGWAHGTGRVAVHPDFPPLTDADVAPVLAAYRRGPGTVRWRSPRPLSSAAVVEARHGPLFVKRHPAAVRRAGDLTEEHRFARHLRAYGVPVPEVLTTPDGATAVEDDRWTWELHALGRGDDAYRDVRSWEPPASPEHAEAVGRALARVALAAEGYAAPPRRTELLTGGWQVVGGEDLAGGLLEHLATRPLVSLALEQHGGAMPLLDVLGPLHARLATHLGDLRPAWTHGDGHPSNLLWDGDEVTAVLDLGLCDRTTAVFDLAVAVERCGIAWLDDEPTGRPDVVAALVRGWAGTRPLTVAEAAALPALLPLVHVDFALSELAHYDQVVRSPADTSAALAYLLGHAGWWQGPAGLHLLDDLEKAVALAGSAGA